MHASALGPLVAAAALLLAFSASGADETGAAVAKPQVKVGDRWAYRRTNNLSKAASITFDSRVASTGPDEIVVVSKRRDRENETDGFYTSEWNAITLATMTFTPHLGHFKFPLEVGGSHVAAWEGIVKGSGWSGKYEVPFKLTGWEEITVPAGKFRALKLEGKGTFRRLDQGGGGWVRVGYWYVPEVKRWVKISYEQGAGGPTSPDTNYVDELVEFHVQ